LLTGVAGVAAWQFYLGNGGVTGATRSVDMPQAETVTQEVNKQESISTRNKPGEDKAINVVDIEQVKQAVAESTLNSDEQLSKYISSAKPEKIMQYYAQLRKARAELVQSQMSTEGVDTAWTDEIKSRFEFVRGVSPVLSNLNISTTDCRQTICALHMQLSKEEYQKVEPYMQHIGTAMGSDAFVHHDAGPNEAVIYVARVDKELPRLDLAQQ